MFDKEVFFEKFIMDVNSKPKSACYCCKGQKTEDEQPFFHKKTEPDLLGNDHFNIVFLQKLPVFTLYVAVGNDLVNFIEAADKCKS